MAVFNFHYVANDAPRVIALHGLPRAGKDTVAHYLVEKYGFQQVAFADKLRREVLEAWPLMTMEMLTSSELKESPNYDLGMHRMSEDHKHLFSGWYFSTLDAGLSTSDLRDEFFKRRSPRWVMQRWGDYRRSQKPLYFVDEVQAFVMQSQIDGKSVVISDLRFPDELEALQRMAAEIWLIKRPTTDKAFEHDTHASNKRLATGFHSVLSNELGIKDLHNLVDFHLL